MLLAGENMDLKDYLYLKRMTINEFSEWIGYSRTHISGIINGRLKPTKKLAQYIEKMTEGEVKAGDLMKGESDENI